CASAACWSLPWALPWSSRAEMARLCPACGAASTIQPQEDLWPSTWSCRACGHAPPRRHGFPQLAAALDEGNEGFDLENFPLLVGVEERNFWFESRNE